MANPLPAEARAHSDTRRALPAMLLAGAACFWAGLVSWLFFSRWLPPDKLLIQLRSLPGLLMASGRILVSDGGSALAAAVLIAAAGFGLGAIAMRSFRIAADNRRELLLAWPLGLGGLGLLTLLLGSWPGFDGKVKTAAWAVLALLAVSGAPFIMRAARGARRPRTAAVVFWCLAGINALFLSGMARWPAVFYDAVTYHLGIPNYFLLEGGIVGVPWDSCAGFPLTAEMLYTLGMFISGQRAAQLLSVLIYLLCAVLVRGAYRSLFPRSDGAVAGIFFLATPTFMEDAVLYTNDLHLTCFVLAAMQAFLLWEKDRRPRNLALTGALTGLALGTKYLAFLFALLPLTGSLALALFRSRHRGPWRAAAGMGWYLFWAGLVYSPWPLKNLLTYGNPFYPALFPLLGGRGMDMEQYRNILAYAHQSPWPQAVAGLLANPWRLFASTPSDAVARFGPSAVLGPLLPMLLPLLLGRRPGASLGRLLGWAGISYVIWSLSFNHIRYLYTSLALLLMAAFRAYEWLRTRRNLIASAHLFFVGAGLAGGWLVGFPAVVAWTKVTAPEHLSQNDDQYLMRRLGLGYGALLESYPVYRLANRSLDPRAMVLIIGDAQHLYIQRRHRYAYLSKITPFDVFREKAGRHEDIARELRRQGVTHIIYSPRELERLQEGGAVGFPASANRAIDDFLRGGPTTHLVTAVTNGCPVHLYGLHLDGNRSREAQKPRLDFRTIREEE